MTAGGRFRHPSGEWFGGSTLTAGEVIEALRRAPSELGEVECSVGTIGDVYNDDEQPSAMLEATKDPMTIRGIIEALSVLPVDRPVTVSTDSWWLNIEAVHARPWGVTIETRDDFDTRQW